jgi:fatty acid/phospholipid biosynthesis enzyme
VFIGHGRSNAVAIKNAIRVAHQAIQADVLAAIGQDVARRFAPPVAAL